MQQTETPLLLPLLVHPTALCHLPLSLKRLTSVRFDTASPLVRLFPSYAVSREVARPKALQKREAGRQRQVGHKVGTHVRLVLPAGVWAAIDLTQVVC